MVRYKRYEEDRNVLDAARDRIDATLDVCDTLVVAFSGGKDSLSTLSLVRERMLARGDTRPVPAFYRDLEVVNQQVTDKVTEVAGWDWVDLRWLCMPFAAGTQVLGRPVNYVAWRDGLTGRTPPEGALTDPGKVYVMEDYDRLVESLWPGRVIIATGLRASESLMRYRAIANKLHEPWLAKSHVDGLTLCRPIYDWLEGDVLRYLWEQNLPPTLLYDAQAWNDQGELRTSSLLANEHMRELSNIKATDPDAYALLLSLDPDIATVERYDRDLKDRHSIGQKARSYMEVRAWILDRYEPGSEMRKRALARLKFATMLARKNPLGFPAWWVQHEIARNGHGTGMMPIPTTHPRYGKEP